MPAVRCTTIAMQIRPAPQPWPRCARGPGGGSSGSSLPQPSSCAPLDVSNPPRNRQARLDWRFIVVPARTVPWQALTSVMRMRAGSGGIQSRRDPCRCPQARDHAWGGCPACAGCVSRSNGCPTGMRRTHCSAMPGSPLRARIIPVLCDRSSRHDRPHGSRQNGPTPLPMFGTSARTSQVSIGAPTWSNVSYRKRASVPHRDPSRGPSGMPLGSRTTRCAPRRAAIASNYTLVPRQVQLGISRATCTVLPGATSTRDEQLRPSAERRVVHHQRGRPPAPRRARRTIPTTMIFRECCAGASPWICRTCRRAVRGCGPTAVPVSTARYPGCAETE